MTVFAPKPGLTHENWPLRAGVARKAPGSPMVIIQLCFLWGVLVLMSNLASCHLPLSGERQFSRKNESFDPWKLAPESRSGRKSSRITRGDHTSMFAMGSFSCNVQLGPYLYYLTNSGSFNHLTTPERLCKVTDSPTAMIEYILPMLCIVMLGGTYNNLLGDIRHGGRKFCQLPLSGE